MVFCSLISDTKFKIENYFESGQLRHNFIYPEPSTENDQMDTVVSTIYKQYEINKEDLGLKPKRLLIQAIEKFSLLVHWWWGHTYSKKKEKL